MKPISTKSFLNILILGMLAWPSFGGTFTNSACLEVSDPAGGLTWNTNMLGLSISCWVKISVPSGVSINQDMVVLVNRRTGTESDSHAYLVKFNASTGSLQFSCKGSKGSFSSTLIQQPYLDRWYHIAVVRQQEEFTGYVDGRQVFDTTGSVGDSGNANGLSIGGWASSKYFLGEIQEVSVYQTALSQAYIVQNLFCDQPAISQLKGYFKLAYSTNAIDSLKNYAPVPIPTGTQTATKQGDGTVQFEEVDQAGEQSYFDSQKNGARDFLVPLSGAFSFSQTVLSRQTPGIAFELRIAYSSANSYAGSKLGDYDPFAEGPLGRGWRHVFETRVLPAQSFSPLADTDTVGVMKWDGSIETWDRDLASTNVTVSDYMTRSKAYRGELTITTTNCVWTTPERLSYYFRRPDSGAPVMRGRLLAIRDFNSNTLQINYDENLGQITNVIDTAGGQYQFFHTNGLLRRVTFGDWTVNLDYDTTNRLSLLAKTNASGRYSPIKTTWRFAYNGSNSLLERVIDPRGNTNVSVAYDQFCRQTNQVNALGGMTRSEYGVPGKRQIRRTDQEGYTWLETFDRNHLLLSRQDPLGNETQFVYDNAGNPVTIIEPLGYKTSIAYDARANIIATTNALGEVSRRIIHPYFNKGTQEIDPLGWTNCIVVDDTTGNLLRNYDALGDLATYTYAANGLVQTSTDGNRNLTRLIYDTNGFAIARIDAASNLTCFAYNELGWKLAETNALGEVTTFTYDLNGNVVRTVDSLARVFSKSFDANGNLVSVSDAKGQITTYAYDPANQRTQTVDRAANVWLYRYTPRGQPFTSRDPLGFASTNFYDAANRLIATADPLGNTVSNVYNPNGKVIATVDQTGQRWAKDLDALGRVIDETDPQGNTKHTTYDESGRIKKIITPNGYPSLHEYDGRARLSKWTDLEGLVWRYDYDGVQNITNITDALGGHYVMRYGSRNERLLERNQDGFEWRYEYDPLLRLQRQTDPNGIERSLGYDAGGRILSITFSTGRVNSFLYDDNNNPEVLSRSGSGPATLTSLTYDALDRVVESTDAFGKKLKFGYDGRGLRISVTYPDNKALANRFDAAGRLTNQVDWADRQMSYAYDRAGRLTRRTYPNGVIQTNSFDTSGRLTALNYSTSAVSSNSISTALTYAYDRNGNKVGWSEKGTLAWPMPSLTDESAQFTASGRLIGRQVQNTLSNENSTISYHYDSNGNMTNAVGGGQSWDLTYDEDNRTTSVLWDAGLTAKAITNRFDAFGRRIAKTVDGVETRYALDLVGITERILCDMDTAGVIRAWYVYGPDLAYKVDASSSIVCYHADAQANVIALTDRSANVVVQYAYTPYGRSLGNSSVALANPYLFVGTQGVMEELPGLYFMRARYYSAETASFLSTDPVKPIGPLWKPTLYAYAESNPLSFTDPRGLWGMYNYVGPGRVGGRDDQPEDYYSDADYEKMYTSAPPMNSIDEAAFHHDRDLATAARSGSFSDALTADSTLYERAISGTATELFAGNLGAAVTGFAVSAAFQKTSLGFSAGDLFNALFFKKEVQNGNFSPLLELGFQGFKQAGLNQLAARSPTAARYAGWLNSGQASIAKLPNTAISIASDYIGGFVADAFGKILPKHTPPIIREVLKAVVGKVTAKAASSVLSALLPTPVGFIVSLVLFFGLPKHLALPLVLIIGGVAVQYWRSQRFRRGLLAFWQG